MLHQQHSVTWALNLQALPGGEERRGGKREGGREGRREGKRERKRREDRVHKFDISVAKCETYCNEPVGIGKEFLLSKHSFCLHKVL